MCIRDSLGLHHAIPVDFDALFELDESTGEVWVSVDTLPGFAEGGVLHGSFAAVNRTRGFMDIAYAEAVVDVEAYMAAGRVEVQETGVAGGCATNRAPAGELTVLLTFAVIGFRRERRDHLTP